MRSLILVVLLSISSVASGQIIAPEPRRPWPCPVPPPCGRDMPCTMPLCGFPIPEVVRQRSDVKVELVDRVLRYEITETFVNRGARVGEADFMFPLPRGAAFQDLKLSINGEMVAGETMSAERARQIYEQIVRQQRDPALLEWMGYGLLRARIFPIAPGEEKKVVVRFQSVAEREGDALRIDYFRGFQQARAETSQMSPERTSFTLTYPDIHAYGRAYSPTHSISSIDRGATRLIEVSNARGEVTILVPVRRNAGAAISLLANSPGNGDGFALIAVSPPATAGYSVPRDVTLVLDVSGSMSGEKIAQARAAGKQVLATLSPTDRFRLIDFSSDVRTFREGYSFAGRENVRAAERYLDLLEAQGSTNISGALDEALAPAITAGRLPIVLFVTDGQPTVGERNPDAIGQRVADRRASRRVFTFGVGADLNVSLIEQLALEGRGTASFVRPNESVERAVGIVASRLANPLVTDVRVHADGVRLRNLHPSGASDIFAGEDLVVLSRYEGSGATILRVDGQTSRGPVTWTTRVVFPERSRENPFVARLWATKRIGYLSAEKRKHGGSKETDDEIRELGERYGIPTEFSSYLVLEPGLNPVPMMRGRASGSPAQLQTTVTTSAGSAQAAPSATGAFEAAKRASVQRSVTNSADMDLASGLSHHSEVRRAGNFMLVLRESVWTDVRASGGDASLRVKPFSDAYFKLIEILPELRVPFSVAERVKVSGRSMTIELTSEGGEKLTERDYELLRARW